MPGARKANAIVISSDVHEAAPGDSSIEAAYSGENCSMKYSPNTNGINNKKSNRKIRLEKTKLKKPYSRFCVFSVLVPAGIKVRIKTINTNRIAADSANAASNPNLS
jgi:hypothetical protein